MHIQAHLSSAVETVRKCQRLNTHLQRICIPFTHCQHASLITLFMSDSCLTESQLTCANLWQRIALNTCMIPLCCLDEMSIHCQRQINNLHNPVSPVLPFPFTDLYLSLHYECTVPFIFIFVFIFIFLLFLFYFLQNSSSFFFFFFANVALIILC